MSSADANKAVALYLRVSTGDQDTAAQERELESFVSVHNVRLGGTIEVYRETASGAAASRPVLDQIHAGARAGRFRALVVWKLDRLGRSLDQVVYFLEEMRRLGVRVISATEGIDTDDTSATATFQKHFLASLAEFQRGQIRERVISGIAAARARGRKFGRPRTVTRDQEASVLEGDRSGFSMREIAKSVGISKTQVGRILTAARSRAGNGPKAPPEKPACPAL